MVLTSIDEFIAVILAAGKRMQRQPPQDERGAGQHTFGERSAGQHTFGERVLVGIAGSPGAGKSTVGADLVGRLGPSAVLLPMDGFHLPQAELVRLGRRDRMGAPDTFDVDGFVAALERVGNSGVATEAPSFDRRIEEPVPSGILVTPEFSTVIVEGNYLLMGTGGWERVAPLLQVTVFVEVDHDIRIEALVARHVAFGKSPQDAMAWALGPDESNARLIEATAGRADHTLRLREPSPTGTARLE